MSILKATLNFINAVNDRVGNLLSYFLFLFFALLFMEVILRYFFNSPTVWANELAQMLFGAYAILAGGYILLTGGHVNVDIPGDLTAMDAKGIAEYGFFDGLDDPLFRFLFSLLDLIPWIP